MEWAKSSAAAGYHNLARSGIPPVLNLSDLPGGPFDTAVHGCNFHGHDGLRNCIAGMYRTGAEHVLLGHGSSGCNFLIAGAVLADGGEAIVETPVYQPILRVVEVFADRIIRLPRREEAGYQPDVDEFEKLLTPKTRLVYLTNLHNPSGRLLEPVRLSGLVSTAAEAGAVVVVDEVYLPMHEPDHAQHAFRYGAVSVNSLNKSWGLESFRVGWAVGPEDIIYKAYRLNNLIGVNQPYPMEDLACRILSSPPAVAELVRRREQAGNGRAIFDRFLEDYPEITAILPTAGISALLSLPQAADDLDFSKRLAEEKDTAVFPGRFFELPGTVRVSFGGDQDIVKEGLHRVGEMMRELTA